MRLAGTAKQYSTKAMPQDTTMAISSGVDLNFKWPYHANVMNMFEAINIRIGAICGGVKAGMGAPATVSSRRT